MQNSVWGWRGWRGIVAKKFETKCSSVIISNDLLVVGKSVSTPTLLMRWFDNFLITITDCFTTWLKMNYLWEFVTLLIGKVPDVSLRTVEFNLRWHYMALDIRGGL